MTGHSEQSSTGHDSLSLLSLYLLSSSSSYFFFTFFLLDLFPLFGAPCFIESFALVPFDIKSRRNLLLLYSPFFILIIIAFAGRRGRKRKKKKKRRHKYDGGWRR